MAAVLVDAGPLIALLNGRDRDHEACLREISRLRTPMLTVWPALTEAAHFLGEVTGGVDRLLSMLTRDAVRILPLSAADVPRMKDLIDKYEDLPMDLADAALVAVAEREGIDTVMTLDRRDFSLYRPRHVKSFKIIP